jgi:hypothetical protein
VTQTRSLGNLPDCAAGGPGRRVGAALTPIAFAGAPKGFVLHAGRNAGKEDNGPALLGGSVMHCNVR